MKKVVMGLVCGAVLALQVNQAYAVKPFLDEFLKKYPDVKAAADVKCNVCHKGENKKMRNEYGMALGELLKKGDAKDTAKIIKSMDDVAAANKKFGDNLKAGKLPTE